MKIERTKNSIKGILSGVINKIILLLVPFIVKSIFINTLGMQYFGLNGLFTSILNILNLAELGVGSAVSFSMYSAIAKNDTKKICALLNLYKKAYIAIGCVVFIAGLLFVPFINTFCNTEIPNDVNIYIIYMLFLLNTCLSYWLLSYKSAILTSHQKNYIINNINTITNLLLNIFQAIVLILWKNYYIYLGVLLFSTALNNLLIAVYTHFHYPDYAPNGKISTDEKKSITKKIKSLFFYKIGYVVLTSVDSIVISNFLGLTILGKYNGYYYIITALFGFFQIFTNALLAGVGNSIEVETREKNIKDFNRINFLLSWIIGFCTVCLICLYQQFMYIWLGLENMFSIYVVVLLAIYFYVWKMMDVINLYKDAAGLWEYDRYRPIVASILNLALNIWLVQLVGIYGIILSTIISIVVVIFPWSTLVLYKYYFKEGYKTYLKNYFFNIIYTVIICIITYLLCSFNETYSLKNFIVNLIICCIIPNILFCILYGDDNRLYECIRCIMEKKNSKDIDKKIIKLRSILKVFRILFIICFIIAIILIVFLRLRSSIFAE